MKNLKGLLWLALLGAIVATLCDANHVLTGTLSYPVPLFSTGEFAGQAWWVFPGFFVVFLAMGLIYQQLALRCASFLTTTTSRAPGGLTPVVETLTLFAFVYLASGFGNAFPVLLSVIFYATFLLRWVVTYERGWLLLLAVLMGIGGMIGEGLIGYIGQVSYRQQDIFHVPFWLGGLYLHGAFALRESVRFFACRN